MSEEKESYTVEDLDLILDDLSQRISEPDPNESMPRIISFIQEKMSQMYAILAAKAELMALDLRKLQQDPTRSPDDFKQSLESFIQGLTDFVGGDK